MKSILITGASGYIGQHIVKLLKDDYKVFALDKSMNTNTGVSFIHKDIVKSVSSLEDLGHYDTIIHLAALVKVNESVEKPTEYYNTNVNGTLNILRNVGFNNFIFASTGAAQQPTSPYALSKRIAEDMVQEYCKDNGKSFTTFRFYNVIGSYAGLKPTNMDGLYYNLIKSKEQNIPFIINGNDYNTKDGTPIRDYIDVRDIALSIAEAVEKPANQLENLGTGVGYSVNEIVTAFNQVNNCNLQVQYGDRRPGDLERTVLDKPSSYYLGEYPIYDSLSLR